MANSISELKCTTNLIYESKSQEKCEVSNVAQEALQNTPSLNSDVKLLKKKIKSCFDFSVCCKHIEKSGDAFTADRRFMLNKTGKYLVADLEFNHVILKTAFRNHINSKGYDYNPLSHLLTNGVEESFEQTQKIWSVFFENRDLMLKLKGECRDVSLECIYKQIDFAVVKDVVKLFMDHQQLIPLLKSRGWVTFGAKKEAQIVSPNGKTCSLEDLKVKWKQQKMEIVQSIQYSGYAYNTHFDHFIYGQEVMTIDALYEHLKDQVIDQLIYEAKLRGFDFDIDKKLFVKDACDVSVREVMIQVHLKHMGLEDIL